MYLKWTGRIAICKLDVDSLARIASTGLVTCSSEILVGDY